MFKPTNRSSKSFSVIQVFDNGFSHFITNIHILLLLHKSHVYVTVINGISLIFIVRVNHMGDSVFRI